MVTLNKPSSGDTDWYQSVTDNWTAIENALTAGAGVKNLILAAKVVSGNADFVSLPSGLTFRLLASGGEPFKADVDGTALELTSNVDLALTDNAHNFVYVQSDGTLGRSALPCRYSFTAPTSPATGKHWFDLGANQMKEWGGSSWGSVSRIFIGYARADSGALNARYGCAPIGITPLQRFEKFGDGSDGFLDVSSGTTTINGYMQYEAVVQRGSGTITHDTYDTGSSSPPAPLYLHAQEGILVIGTSNGIDVSAKGVEGESAPPGNNNGGAAAQGGFGGSGGGGGGGEFSHGGSGGSNNSYFRAHAVSFRQGGEGAAGGGDGGDATGDQLSGYKLPVPPTLPIVGCGGGGGGGGQASGGTRGGAGGGFVCLIAPFVAIGSSAKLAANGESGPVSAGNNKGSGGGGGGGFAGVWARNYFLSGTHTATKGTGGASGGTNSGAGGDGIDGATPVVRV